MNPKTLEALIIDRNFGELSPEVTELLDAYLEANPQTRGEVSGIEDALSVTEIAVGSRSELFREGALERTGELNREEKVTPFPGATWFKAAAAIALLALVGIGGYFAGNRSSVPDVSSAPGQPPAGPLSNSSPSPWAQYRIASGGIVTSIPTPSSGPRP